MDVAQVLETDSHSRMEVKRRGLGCFDLPPDNAGVGTKQGQYSKHIAPCSLKSLKALVGTR
jgi:hypothetical protein